MSKSQAELEEANERLMAALKASRCGTWRWDIAQDRVQWDEALLGVYGIEKAPTTVAEFVELVHPEDRDRIAAAVQACLAGGSELEYEFRTLASGQERWIYDRSSLTRDADGRPLAMTGACLEVTQRKRIEQERDHALEKHRWFLKELNHRIKNHLQLITAMLSLQANTVSDEAKQAFTRAIQRINVIAELHARLYRDDTHEWVDAQGYLSDICDGLRHSLLGSDSGIVLDCLATSSRLTLDQAVPMGLIVNELVTNAIKYAYPAGGKGRIDVSFAVNGTSAELRVADDGLGQKNGDATTRIGLGHRLVNALAGQLGASIQMETQVGTSHRLVFPAGGANGGR